MTILKTSSLFFGAIAITGSAGTTSAYIATSTTIGEYLKDDLLDKSSTNDWKTIQGKLIALPNIHTYSDLGLESIKKQEHSNNGDLIKAWCEKKYENHINPTFSWFPFSNQRLLNATKEFCILPIEEKLGGQKLELDKDEKVSEVLKSKFDSLNSHDDSRNGKLVPELTELKNRNKDTDWIKLRDWCKVSYKRGFKTEEDNLWKLVQSYCKQ